MSDKNSTISNFSGDIVASEVRSEEAKKNVSPLPESPTVSKIEQFLQYGDIIQIYTDDPQNALHEKTFLVDYLDDDKIRIINTTTTDSILLPFDETGALSDPSIRRIELLTRAKEPGFARQKGLTVDQWVDVYFIGVDSPITGKITHLEEDQIELTLHPSQETI